MKKILIVACVAIALGVFGFFAYKTAPTGGQKPFAIGSILPSTGDFGYLGNEVDRGAQLAIAEAQAAGVPVSYQTEDDGFDPARSVSAAQKLTAVDKVDAVFTALAEEAKPSTLVFNNAKTPLLVAWDSNEQIKAAGPYIFSIGFSTEKDGVLLADYAYKTLGLRKMASVWTVGPFTDVIAAAFEQEFTQQGGAIVAKQRIQYDESDHRTLVAQIKSANPDGIFIAVLPPQNVTFLTQLRRAGFDKPLLSADSLISSDIQSAGNAAEGAYVANIYAEHADEVAQKYKAYFGKETTETTLVSFGYDSIKTLIAAHQLAQEKNIPLRDALTMVKVQGLGATIDMKGSQTSERVEKIYQVKNSKLVEVSQ